ncbi:MAG: type II secretion system protein [Sedimentisphaerales bacterium]
MKAKKTGFTLVELLVVISIIALLLAVLVPAMKRAKEIARRIVCSSQLRQVGIGMRAYASSYDGQLPADYIWDTTDPKNPKKTKETHPYVLYRGDKAPWTKGQTADGRTLAWPLRLAWLYEKKFIGEPRTFYCQGNVDRLYRYESYTNPAPWGFLPQESCYTPPRGISSNGNQWVRSGYSYYPTDPTSTKNMDWMVVPASNQTPAIYAPVETTEKFDRLDKAIPYMTDSINSRSGLAHKSGMKVNGTEVTLANAGLNALFADGHVVFATNKAIFTDPQWDGWDIPEGSDVPRTILASDYPKFYYKIFLLIGGNRVGLTGGRTR